MKSRTRTNSEVIRAMQRRVLAGCHGQRVPVPLTSVFVIAEKMMSQKSHASLVAEQFGPRAAAYVSSAVHSQGEDLDALVGVVSRHDKATVLDLGCGGGHVSFR